MEALHTNHFVDFDFSFFFRFIYKFCLRKVIIFNSFFYDSLVVLTFCLKKKLIYPNRLKIKCLQFIKLNVNLQLWMTVHFLNYILIIYKELYVLLTQASES